MPSDDFSLFTEQMQGVRRIHVDQADVGKAKINRAGQRVRRENAQQVIETIVVDGLSDQFVIDVGAEDALYWARDGVQDTQLRRMKAGQIAFEGSLDLHGMNVETARSTLREFLTEALRLEVRCVRVTHGKAARLDGKKPMIKSHVNTWLRQHEKVLGFTSCVARHGGTGALYVLLKRHMLDGRDD
ncbi:MAG: Smr/MutS family protein [Pseudomonas sp.]|nr:Smr/MutS family protein [Pseudomonas sp.]